MNELASTILKADLMVLLLGMLFTLIAKDIVFTIATGILFKLNRDFNVGDKILYNGKKATIISIGYRQSIFEIEENEDKLKVWEYIYNDRIKYQNLGKIKD